jgi:uncharacterized membrane protein HdeD (DUF308 family)
MTHISSPAELLGDVRRYGTALMIAGVIGVIAGILALAYPDLTLLALALIAGINLLFLGIINIVEAFGDERDATSRILCVVIGLLGIIAGLVVMRRPGESLLAILVVLGIWLVLTGIVDFVRAFSTLEDRALRLMAALADLILGILILALPKLSLGTLAILVGIAFVVRGVVAVVRGWHLRRAAGVAADASPSAMAT